MRIRHPGYTYSDSGRIAGVVRKCFISQIVTIVVWNIDHREIRLDDLLRKLAITTITICNEEH